MRGLKDKTFLIAGGATGIGAATAERLAGEGASVAIGDLNIAGATAPAQRIAESGGRAFAVEFDLADEAVRAAASSTWTIKEFSALTVCTTWVPTCPTHNLGRDTTILDTDMDVWLRTLDVNLLRLRPHHPRTVLSPPARPGRRRHHGTPACRRGPG